MRTNQLKSIFETVLLGQNSKEKTIVVKSLNGNDEGYILEIPNDLFVPKSVFKHLESIGRYGVKAKDSTLQIHVYPTIPHVDDDDFDKKIGEYFDNLQQSLPGVWMGDSKWRISTQGKRWTLSRGADFWMREPSEDIYKQHECIKNQLEYITETDWHITEIRKEDDSHWVRFELESVPEFID